MRVLRLDVDQAPQLVDLEPLQVFSLLGPAGDSFMKHVAAGADAVFATDAHASGMLAPPIPGRAENTTAAKLAAALGADLRGQHICGVVFVVGIDAQGKMQDTPPHFFEVLAQLGHHLPNPTRISP